MCVSFDSKTRWFLLVRSIDSTKSSTVHISTFTKSRMPRSTIWADTPNISPALPSVNCTRSSAKSTYSTRSASSTYSYNNHTEQEVIVTQKAIDLLFSKHICFIADMDIKDYSPIRFNFLTFRKSFVIAHLELFFCLIRSRNVRVDKVHQRWYLINQHLWQSQILLLLIVQWFLFDTQYWCNLAKLFHTLFWDSPIPIIKVGRRKPYNLRVEILQYSQIAYQRLLGNSIYWIM